MRVDFYGAWRQVVGARSLAFEVAAGLTVRGLLEAIAARHPEARAELFDAAGQLYAQVPVFVNGRNPRLLAGGLDAPLAAGDVVSVFTPIASGRLNVETLRMARPPADREDA